MDLCLQFGWGMMEHCRALVSLWGGGTVILSPRDLEPAQLQPFASSITSLAGGRVLLDPQFYLPHADHQRLSSHAFWPQSYSTTQFWSGTGAQQLVNTLLALNQSLGSAAFILPGCFAAAIDDDWIETQQSIQTQAVALDGPLPLYATIALGADLLRDQNQVAALMEAVEDWSGVQGYYVVAEHPNGQYLIEDPMWLANLLDVCAGLRLQSASVILGYCNHQALIAAATKVTAIASGTYLNVRSFPPGKFLAPYEEEMKQRATWYYAPKALSEYKVPFLDIARTHNLLNDLAPSADLMEFCGSLFSGVQPSLAPFTETLAFRHYLHCLRAQAMASTLPTFDDTVAYHNSLLDEAETLLTNLHSRGIRCYPRDFLAAIDSNRAALGALNATRGSILRYQWAQL